ncbi:MAG: hypothetical protein PHW52_00345 [Candidatus Pacebacteria bacterium]|nr:hypothetical protein [Candidatus Paceibacterota bacterium]
MTNLFNNFKLDKWWRIVLCLGISSVIGSFVYTPQFIEAKNLFGIGLGMILVGISYIMAESSHSWIKPPNAYTGGTALITQDFTKHNIITRTICFIGICLIITFGFLIIRALI